MNCSAVRFSDVRKDVCLMQDLDVVVGTHGAQLANGLFLPPRTSVVEIRAWGWFDVPASTAKRTGKAEQRAPPLQCLL